MRISRFVLFSAFLAGCGVLALAATGSGWVPAWPEQMGISLEKNLSPTDEFEELTAKVEHPEKLKALGIEGTEEGSEIRIRYAGAVGWSAELEGVQFRPCVIRVILPSGKATTLSPKRETLELLPPPPPFRGSMAPKPN